MLAHVPSCPVQVIAKPAPLDRKHHPAAKGCPCPKEKGNRPPGRMRLASLACRPPIAAGAPLPQKTGAGCCSCRSHAPGANAPGFNTVPPANRGGGAAPTEDRCGLLLL